MQTENWNFNKNQNLPCCKRVQLPTLTSALVSVQSMQLNGLLFVQTQANECVESKILWYLFTPTM